MTDIVVHTFQTHQVRTLIGPDGAPRFVLADICAALSINNVGNVVKSLDEDNIHTMDVTDTIGRTRKTNVVTEPGLYEVIFQSRKPEAKAFRRWVTSEVLPSIRKTGAYMTPEVTERVLTDPDFIIQLAAQMKEERARREAAEAQIEADKHHVQYSKTLVASNADLLVKQVAGAITAAGVPIGPISLFEWLRRNGWLCRNQGRLWNNPTHWAISHGYMRSSVTLVTTSSGSRERVTPYVTTTGQQKLITGFLDGTYKLPDNHPTMKKGN